MSGVDIGAVAAALLASAASLAGVGWTIHDRREQNRVDTARANDPELRALENAAYERARASYEAAIRVAERRANDVEARLEDCEDRSARAAYNARKAVARAESAESVARRQTRTLRALRRELRNNGIPIPAHLDGDDDVEQDRT